MSEHQSSLQKFSLPLPVLLLVFFFTIVAIFLGYALLLKEKALNEEDLLRSELRELREEHQELLSQQLPDNNICDCPNRDVEPPPTPQPANTDLNLDLKQQQSFTYTVQKGDNLWTIAARYRVQPEALMRWNNLTPRSRIFPGDQLTIILTEEKEQEHRENSPDYVQPGSGDRPAGSSYQILDQPDQTVR